jgi:lysophospholipase L1-like esterase
MTTPPTIILSKGSGITGTPAVASGGSGYVAGDQITLTGGTALSAAILQVSTVSGGAVTAVTVVRNGVYTATPGNPVAQGSTTGSGTGATFTVSWSAAGATTALNRVKIAATDARMRFTGVGPITNQGGSGYYGGSVNSAHSTFEWATDSQHVDLNLAGLNTSGILYVDGQQVSATTVATDSSGLRYAYSLDFGSAQMRSFKWVAFNQAFDGVWVDGTATLIAPFLRTPPLAWSLGDSYTGATGAENPASQHIMIMADQLGIDVIPDGIGGSGYNSTGTTAPNTRVTQRLGGLTRTPQYVFLDLGFNDAGGNMTTLAANFDATVAAVQAVAPGAKIIVFGPATPLGRTTNLDLVRSAVSARCAAAGITFIDVADVVNSGNTTVYTGGDNIHPNARGHKFLGSTRAKTLKALGVL